MPKYRVTLSDGRIVTLEAPAPPSEADVLAALGEQQVNVGSRASFTVNNQPVVDEGPLPPGPAGGKPFSAEEFAPQANTDDPGALSGAWDEIGAPLVALPGAAASQQTGAVNTLGRAFKGQAGVGESVDALAALLGGMPYLMGKGMIQGSAEQGAKAWRALRAGNVPEAQGRSLAAMLPMLGPDAAGIAEDIVSRPRYGFGRLAALLGSVGAAPLLRAIPRGAPAAASAERTAAAAMLDRGVPVDLGTATGNRFVRGTQYLAEQTPLGAIAENAARGRRGEAMARVGHELADELTPGMVVTPETAGQVAHERVAGRAKDWAQEANTAYGTLRDLESTRGRQQVRTELPTVAKGAISEREAVELSRMVAEMENVQYTPRTWTKQEFGRGDQATNFDITGGSPNAPVYAEVMGDLSPITAKQLRNAIEAGLEGQKSVWFDRALEVARDRISGKSNSAILPEDAGRSFKYTTMDAPFDLRETKAALRPVFTKLRSNMASLREAPSQMRLSRTQQAQAQSLTILDELMQMPDKVPASAADSVLSNLKRILRNADSPLALTPEERIAAMAIDKMEQAMQKTLEAIGPEAVEARNTGRAATTAQHEAADFADQLKAEPVRAYRDFVTAGDTSIDKLRELERVAPGTAPFIGRAFLEGLLEKATKDGGFARGPAVANEWQKLGDGTRRMLFPNREYLASLDQFFLMARKLADNINTSNTAGVTTTKDVWRMAATGGAGAGLATAPLQTLAVLFGAGGLVKAFHSPTFVKAVVRYLNAPASAPGRRAAAVRNVTAAAKAAGVEPLAAVPAVASGDRESPGSAPSR